MTDGVSAAAQVAAAASGGDQAQPEPPGGQAPGAEARFDAAMDRAREQAAAPLASETAAADAVAPAVKGVFDRLAAIDGRAQRLADEAKAAEMSGSEFTPGEMVMLSVRAHEFMFHAQLTSNMANRTSDGLQQLFRQQS